MDYSSNYKELFQNIKAILFDVDGVLTDGSITLFPDGSMVRKMSTRDGYAIQKAIRQGIVIGIITGGTDPMVKERCENLGIKDIYLGAKVKLPDYENFIAKYGFKDEEILYMGDDIPDLPVMKRVGLPCAPNDAAYENREIAKYISRYNGGEGCGRDVIEQVLKSQDLWTLPADIRSV